MDAPPPAEPVEQHATAPPAAVGADAPGYDAALPSPKPRYSREEIALDLSRSGTRRLLWGPICGAQAAGLGLIAMATWSPDPGLGPGALAVTAEGSALTGFALLASGVQLQRRAQLQLGVEPGRNGWATAGYALGGGALVLGALSPGALGTDNKPLIYTTTGGAAVLGIGGLTALVVANVQELRVTGPLLRHARGLDRLSLGVGPTGVSGTW